MARPITQDQRRRDIVDAAIALLMEENGEVGIADVARRLDLTPNAIRYYYRDGDALHWAVRARVEERFLTERAEAIATSSDPRVQLVRAMGAGLPLGPDDAEWRVTFRPLTAGPFNPEFGEVIRDVFSRQADVYQEVLDSGTTAGVFRPSVATRDIARMLMVMEDYMGFRIVALDPDFSRVEALRLMCDYASQVTGAELAQAEAG